MLSELSSTIATAAGLRVLERYAGRRDGYGNELAVTALLGDGPEVAGRRRVHLDVLRLRHRDPVREHRRADRGRARV